jgi:prepilin-type N-terminal cleavage/methylation domain-containing protein
MKKGITLLELILAMVLVASVLTIAFSGYLFILSNMMITNNLFNTHMQIDYALQNMELYCSSAVQIDPGSMFAAGISGTKTEFGFTSDSDIYNVTPDISTDDARYRYFINNTASSQGLLFSKTVGGNTTEETLVDSQLNPQIHFNYTQGTEPNFMTVAIEAGPPTKRISKSVGIRFWFVDIVQ